MAGSGAVNLVYAESNSGSGPDFSPHSSGMAAAIDPDLSGSLSGPHSSSSSGVDGSGPVNLDSGSCCGRDSDFSPHSSGTEEEKERENNRKEDEGLEWWRREREKEGRKLRRWRWREGILRRTKEVEGVGV
uniref:Uncharacterized protein n=1 Tax=Opuntia streptacantha TaxID=393608 RepID=A0A7C9DGR4_OPUST